MKSNKPRDNYEIAKKTLEINNEISPGNMNENCNESARDNQ